MANYSKLEDYYLELSLEEQEKYLMSLLDVMVLLDKLEEEKKKRYLFQIFDHLYQIYSRKKLEAGQRG